MSYADVFLADILANPADDVPRLIYADWLEENGELARAEFIRVQIELAKPREQGPELWALQQREEELLHKGRGAWLGRIRELVLGTTFRRGFVHTVTMEPAGFVEYADELFALAPVQGLRLMTRTGLYDPSLVDPKNELVTSRHLRRLTHLQLNVPFNADQGQALAAKCEALAELAIDANLLGLEEVRPFLEGPRAAGLRSLSLPASLLDPNLVRLVSESATLANLATLRLQRRGNGLSRQEIELLGASPQLSRLRTLDLCDNRLDEESVRALTRGAFMPHLEELALGGNGLGDQGARALAYGIYAPNLRRLDLSRNELGTAALSALAGGDGMSKLTELDLRQNLCSDLVALANADRLANLRVLRLRGSSVTDQALRALVEAPLLKRLLWLDLSHTPITDLGASALLDADLGTLARIDLARCRITQAMRDRLQARLGGRVRFS